MGTRCFHNLRMKMESQDCNAKVHSRDGIAHDAFGSVRVGEEMYGSTTNDFFWAAIFLSVTSVPPLTCH